MKESTSTAASLGARNAVGSDALDDVASDWLVRRYAGFSAEEEAEFRRWLSTDARHGEAFARIETAWTALNRPRELGEAGAVSQELRARNRRRQRRQTTYGFATAGLAAAAALVFALLPPDAPRSFPSTPITVTVKPDRQVLPDGSRVELNAGAEIEVAFSPQARGVRLVRGEALFAVARDADRPFIVTAGAVEVRAVGTAFAVRYEPKEVDVIVTEGHVAVERVELAMPASQPRVGGGGEANRSESRTLAAGQRLAIQIDPLASPSSPVPAVLHMTARQIESALAWRGKRLEFTGTPLAEAVVLLNRHNRIQFSIADPAISALQISGIFWADDPDGFARLLATGMNVSHERVGDTILLRGR
ncbi:MAG: FecR family protein [Opitutaceae bacterium]